MTNLVFGIGINNRRYPAVVNGKITKGYALWSSLLKRCYNPKVQQEKPTYIGCSVSENFKNYSYFHDWCQTQIGFGQEGFDLDKDLLLRGGKTYSEDTCLFLPRELNTLLISCKTARGSLPVGVSARRGKFRVDCSTDKPSTYVGYFNTPELAFQAYKKVKEAFIKQQAEKWEAFIDPRAYQALLRYEVLVTD